MYDIYGKDVGTTIDFRRFGRMPGSEYEAKHPWPTETRVSAGNGVVFVRGEDESYTTLFMEVYPPGASFIRGEGETPEACEDSAWEQYQKALNCIEGHQHEWEPRKYRNGVGFCKHCGTYKSQAFTAEELGLFCSTCGVATNWSFGENGEIGCKEHPVEQTAGDSPLKALLMALDDE